MYRKQCTVRIFAALRTYGRSASARKCSALSFETEVVHLQTKGGARGWWWVSKKSSVYCSVRQLLGRPTSADRFAAANKVKQKFAVRKYKQIPKHMHALLDPSLLRLQDPQLIPNTSI